MKRFLKILGILLLLVILAAVGFFIYFNSKFPLKIEVQNVKVEATPERLARGEYLAHHVTGCIDCHSDRDFRYYAGPTVDGTWGKGGFGFDEKLAGIPGIIYTKNITPAGLGDWSDGELIRMITTGINKKGKANFPLMPFLHYPGLCQEDLYSIVAYIRTLKPIENKVPDHDLNFPMNLIVKTIPQPASPPPPMPDRNESVTYGEYLVNAAACIDCHSQADHGELLPGMEFAGGRKFVFPNNDIILTANITPDLETGIGSWTKERFLERFKSYVDSSDAPKLIPVENHQKNTIMPWSEFGGMTVQDLTAIYYYLRTLKPVKNKVETFTAAK